MTFSVDRNSKINAMIYIRLSLVVSLFLELISIYIIMEMQSATSQDYRSDYMEEIDPVYNMSLMTSIFEILQCIGEMIHIMYEFNYNRIKKDRIQYIDLIMICNDDNVSYTDPLETLSKRDEQKKEKSLKDKYIPVVKFIAMGFITLIGHAYIVKPLFHPGIELDSFPVDDCLKARIGDYLVQ